MLLNIYYDRIFYNFVIMETVGEKIKRIRKSKGISQYIVAESCRIKQSSYANIESGKTQNITIEIGKGISLALGVNFAELFEIEPAKSIEAAEVMKKNEELTCLIETLDKTIQGKDEIIQLQKQHISHLKYSIIAALSVAEQSALSGLIAAIEDGKMSMAESISCGVLLTATQYVEILENQQILSSRELEVFRKMEQKGIKEMIKRIEKDIVKNAKKRITSPRKSK